MHTWMGGIGFVFMLAYFAVMVGVVVIALISLWRGMRAQEAMARSLDRIEQVLAQQTPRS